MKLFVKCHKMKYLFAILSGTIFVSAFPANWALCDKLEAALNPSSEVWPHVWTTYRTVKSIDEDFIELKAHGVDGVMLPALTVEEARVYLQAARKHGIRLGVSLGKHLLPNAEMVEDAGLKPEYAVMIGGVYQGRAIDRHLFEFTPQAHEIIVEQPVYNQEFAYTGRVSGERIAHYYPDIGGPLRAEIVVPLAEYNGKQHLRIIKAKVEKVSGKPELEKDSVSDSMASSYETRDRKLYRLRFDLTGMGKALLDRVGVAVYWEYRGSPEWYILDWAPVSMTAASATQALRSYVKKQLGIWTQVNGGSFPVDEVVALRVGDETFYLTGHTKENTPSVNYPLWDYGPTSVNRFREIAGIELAPPRTWGYPEIYGGDAYSLWMYTLHKGCAEICGVARAEARKISPDIMVFRNTTRSDVFALSNDHDGSGPELLTQNLDLAHLDPYPVSASGYKNNIPRDMSYYGGLARRYQKPLLPWMQAHSYIGLEHVSPEQIGKMEQEQWGQGVDAIMWLGYGKDSTFPLVKPDSWERAAEFHRRLKRKPPRKPVAQLAVIRSYDSWALTNMANGVVRNPDDWLLQQWLEVWSVEHGRPYDVFEVPPACLGNTDNIIRDILKRYPKVVSNIPVDGVWYVGEGNEEQELSLADKEKYRRRFERQIKGRGWF